MAIKAKSIFFLKYQLFNKETTRELAASIKQVSPEFDHAGFVRASLKGFKTRELKQRASWLVECLRPRLPERFEDAAEILLGALPPPLGPTHNASLTCARHDMQETSRANHVGERPRRNI